jgi:hypothetical protein
MDASFLLWVVWTCSTPADPPLQLPGRPGRSTCMRVEVTGAERARLQARGAAEEARFVEAVDAFTVHDLELDIERRADIRLAGKLSAGGPILAGERHGVEQNPLVIHTLMRHLGLRVLALEWPADLQPALDEFLAGATQRAGALAGGADGRVTAGHLAAIRALHRDGMLDRVVLFDFSPWPRTWSERDWGMAVRLLEGIAGAPPALVVTGGLHARLRRHSHGEPMGAHVARARPGTVEMRLRYPGGLAGNSPCLLRSAGAWLEMTVPGARPAA